jgi:hypothetical protein
MSKESLSNYSALAKTRNGAQEGFVGTRQEIKHWLSGWKDPENLHVSIEDENGVLYREKPFGKKIFKWLVDAPLQLNYNIEQGKAIESYVLDMLRVLCGTVESYIDISKTLNVPTHFLEDISSGLQSLLEEVGGNEQSNR